MRNNASVETGLKEKIKALRRKGLSYREIAKKLNCSKGLVSYHCSKGQKEKTAERLVKWKENNHERYLYLKKEENRLAREN
tara:strand:+ start:42 stop:284 length:243 start_codon:yes stop_codon:yes gene_type:complete